MALYGKKKKGRVGGAQPKRLSPRPVEVPKGVNEQQVGPHDEKFDQVGRDIEEFWKSLAEQRIAEVNKKTAEIAQLGATSSQLQKEIKFLEMNKKDKEDEIENLDLQIEEKKGKLNSMEDEMIELKAKIEEKDEKQMKLLESINNKLGDVVKRLWSLESQRTELELDIKELKVTKKKAMEKIESELEERRKGMEKELQESMEEKKKNWEKELQSSENSLKDREKKVRKALEDLRKWSKDVEQKRQIMAKQEAELEVVELNLKTRRINYGKALKEWSRDRLSLDEKLKETKKKRQELLEEEKRNKEIEDMLLKERQRKVEEERKRQEALRKRTHHVKVLCATDRERGYYAQIKNSLKKQDILLKEDPLAKLVLVVWGNREGRDGNIDSKNLSRADHIILIYCPKQQMHKQYCNKYPPGLKTMEFYQRAKTKMDNFGIAIDNMKLEIVPDLQWNIQEFEQIAKCIRSKSKHDGLPKLLYPPIPRAPSLPVDQPTDEHIVKDYFSKVSSPQHGYSNVNGILHNATNGETTKYMPRVHNGY